MRFCFIGAGAVGGYYGALLSRAGEDVSFIARGAHLQAIRERGLRIFSTAVGDFVARIPAHEEPAAVGPVDVVVLAVKTYDNDTALPMIAALAGPKTVVLTLQNGVDSADQVAAAAGEGATLAGATYIAAGIEAPGVIRQNGAHRRIVFGEVFGPRLAMSSRVTEIARRMLAADIHAETVADARPALWEKFIYLAPFASFTGAARAPIGPIWSEPGSRKTFLAAVAEVEAVARAAGIEIAPGIQDRIQTYINGIPPTTRSSLLIDLTQGKRIELDSLTGSVVRRGQATGVPTPIMSALYAVLRGSEVFSTKTGGLVPEVNS